MLAPHNFAKIVPGMPMETMRRMLGKPMKTMTFALKKETAWGWRYMESPNNPMIFTVYFAATCMCCAQAVRWNCTAGADARRFDVHTACPGVMRGC